MRNKTNRTVESTFTGIIVISMALIALLVLGIPNFVNGDRNRPANACINNMRQIEGAKDQAALEHGLAIGDDPAAFVAAFIKGGIPTCPVRGAAYVIGNVGTEVTCPTGGTHVLPKDPVDSCINNLRQIEGAKNSAALENGLAIGDDPEAFVAAFIKGGIPTCPARGAAYVIGNVGTDVTCSSGIATHVLPNRLNSTDNRASEE